MTTEKQVALFVVAVACLSDIIGMYSENQQRLSEGISIAYPSSDFFDISKALREQLK